jgi:hypothetical protein
MIDRLRELDKKSLDYAINCCERVQYPKADKAASDVELLMNALPKFLALYDAAKKFTASGDMPEGFSFTKEDAEDYLNLRIAVDGMDNND